MNTTYLEAAKDRINNVPLLINLISRRVRQLNRGQRPLVKVGNPQMPAMDIALKEVADGVLTAEMAFTSSDTVSDDNLIPL